MSDAERGRELEWKMTGTEAREEGDGVREWWEPRSEESLQVHEGILCRHGGAGTDRRRGDRPWFSRTQNSGPPRGSWIGDFVCGPPGRRGVCILIPHPTWGRGLGEVGAQRLLVPMAPSPSCSA